MEPGTVGKSYDRLLSNVRGSWEATKPLGKDRLVYFLHHREFPLGWSEAKNKFFLSRNSADWGSLDTAKKRSKDPRR